MNVNIIWRKIVSIKYIELSKLPIMIQSSHPLGGYLVEILYDPESIVVEEVAGGAAPGFSACPVSDEAAFSSGRTRIAGVNAGGLNPAGDPVHVADVTFKLLQPLRGRNPGIVLRALSLKNTQGEALGAGREIAVPAESFLPLFVFESSQLDQMDVPGPAD